MSALRVLAAVGVLTVAGSAGLGACSSDLGPPRVRRLPVPDTSGEGGLRPVVGGPRTPRLASYAIDARLDAAAHRITATQTLTWVNSGTTAVDTLPFHLYLNAFKNESSLFMVESGGQHRGERATDEGWGWIDVTSIKVAGAELRPTARFPGPDETVLELPLTAPVEPGQTVVVDFAFTAQLPEVFARTGYKGDFTMVGQWFPKIGVRTGLPGAETWVCEPFHANSEFFADFGTYDVTLTVPDTHVVAATGILTAVTDHPDPTRTLVYRAEDVHDFAWMADPYMEVMSGTARVEGHQVEVRVYHRPAQRDFARRHLAAGIGTIEQLSTLLAPYPWPVMSIVDPPLDAAGSAGGMEYPTLVTTAGDHAGMRPGMRLPELVTIHEVTHNWFQGLLASNEGAEGWLDEGLTEWASAVVLARLYGERGSFVDWMGWTGEYLHVQRAIYGDLADLPTPIATESWRFVDFETYATATYAKTSLALRTLENLVGRDAFSAAMGVYAREWLFRHPTGTDLFATLGRALDRDLSWFVQPAFYGTGVVELAVQSSDCKAKHDPRGVFGEGDTRKTVSSKTAPDTAAWQCEVVITNTGTVPVPVEIELRFADGGRQRELWDHKGPPFWHRIRFERSSPLTEIEIDPDSKVLLTDDLLDDHIRREPETRAAMRAGARAGFWAQTLMQVLGL
jgi:hypothetical protein